MTSFRIVLLLALAALVPCSGAVMYQLAGTSAAAGVVLFEETVPSFILADATIAAGDLDDCQATLEACLQVVFEPVSSHDASYSSIEFFTTTTSTLFFFDPGSFAAPGVYNTVFGAGTGTLTVTDTGTVIPEPQ